MREMKIALVVSESFLGAPREEAEAMRRWASEEFGWALGDCSWITAHAPEGEAELARAVNCMARMDPDGIALCLAGPACAGAQALLARMESCGFKAAWTDWSPRRRALEESGELGALLGPARNALAERRGEAL